MKMIDFFEKEKRALHQVSNSFRHPDFRMSFEEMEYLIECLEWEESGLRILINLEKVTEDVD